MLTPGLHRGRAVEGYKQARSITLKDVSLSHGGGPSLLDQPLRLHASLPLKSLEVILFIAGMLIYEEEMVSKSSDDEPFVELSDYRHFNEFRFSAIMPCKRGSIFTTAVHLT